MGYPVPTGRQLRRPADLGAAVRTTLSILAILISTSLGVAAGTSYAASPAVSRGEVLLDTDHDQCMTRARAAFTAEGFTVVPQKKSFTNYVLARKGIHTAYITCSPAPRATMWANIFVASWDQDKRIPGAVRERLQERLRPFAQRIQKR